jgi:hypothetical protein
MVGTAKVCARSDRTQQLSDWKLLSCLATFCWFVKKCTTLKNASNKLLQLTDIDKCSNRELSVKRKEVDIQKDILVAQPHRSSSVNENIETETRALKDQLLKEYQGLVSERKLCFETSVTGSWNISGKGSKGATKAAKENVPLLKEIADLRTKLSDSQRQLMLQADLHNKDTGIFIS